MLDIFTSEEYMAEKERNFKKDIEVIKAELLQVTDMLTRTYVSPHDSDTLTVEIKHSSKPCILEVRSVKTKNGKHLIILLREITSNKPSILNFEISVTKKKIEVNHRKVRSDFRNNKLASIIAEQIENFTKGLCRAFRDEMTLLYKIGQYSLLKLLHKQSYSGASESDQVNVKNILSGKLDDQIDIDPETTYMYHKSFPASERKPKNSIRITMQKTFGQDQALTAVRQSTRTSLQNPSLPLNLQT